MGRSKEEMEGVTLLGNKDVKYSMDYAPEMLQTFDNKHPDNDYFVKFNCPEFTSLGVHIICAGREDGGEQVAETVSVQLQKSRRLP